MITEFGRRETSLSLSLLRMRCLCLKNTECTLDFEHSTTKTTTLYANSKLIFFTHLKLRSKGSFNKFIYHVLRLRSYETECVGKNDKDF